VRAAGLATVSWSFHVSSINFHEEEELFHTAAAIGDLDQRRRFLEDACSGDPARLARLRALLEVHAQSDSVRDVREASPSWPQLPPLEIGRFRVLREIGRGGFGVVMLAHDPERQEPVALKVPRAEMLLNPKARERFLLEAKTVASLQHPQIVKVLEVGDTDSICYIATAYCPGQSLDRFLADAQQQRRPPLTFRQIALVVEQLAGAVDHVHQRGILHRDLKPSNVLLWPREEAELSVDELPFIPQLTDFGLAKFVEQGLEDTTSSMLVGTPLYMAPEQAECRRAEIGPATDVYALGAILYELLTGTPPFVGIGFVNLLDRIRSETPLSPSRLRRGTPAALDRICLKCLAKEPRDRYASAADLADDLQRFGAGQSVRARGPSLARRFSSWFQHPQRMWDAGVWTILANLIMLLWVWGNALVLFTADEVGGRFTIPRVLFSMAFGAVLHLPSLFLGWKVMRRQLCAMYASLVFALICLALAIAPLAGGPVPFPEMYPDRLSTWNVFWLLSILFSTQVFLLAAAITARRKTR
jgi:serine/threonine protein kinase